ncbi:WD40 repeat protein [Plasmopara halstedii]|uniref:WD40 repeat protein n=1 Tax=Plasmopara halstedii TaxID=4781 RepID=A0A0P1AEI9_PLAHL|nr:WD40 repeat protein [Plasmopara halstedii]CEG39489.1 WD40 repeat protein [Plasmopara halstedii]|eukprot:XP_024575858.1 WD40 repeat protein [Plasmopara halstedii]
MDSLAWVVALVMMLAGAGYVLVKQREKDSRQALMAQKQNEKLARQEFHALNSKKAKGKTKKKVDVTADLKKKSQNFALQDDDQDHPSLITVLRGHKYGVTAAAYSPNGRFVATASSDRSIRLYFRDTLKDKNPKLHNIKIDYDHVTAMNFSSDGRSFVVATESGNIKVYQKLRVKPQIVTEFPISHKADVHSVLMNDIGNWATVITCAGDSDTDVKFWNLNGELLQVVNTNQVTNYHCVGSKDNRYIAVAAYTPEVKIYEIVRERTGAFKKVQKIMTLHGHRTGVVDLAFNGSDTLPVDRVVTISKDASLRVWDINVRYTVQEDPKVLSSFNVSEGEAFQATDFAPNGKMLVMVRGKDLVFIRISDNKVFSTIKNAIEDLIKRATFSPDGSEVLVLGKNCKHVKIYKTPEL